MPLRHQNAFYSNYLLFSSGKVSILKKFETENVFQETAEVFEDETATSEEIIEAGLNLLMKRYLNLTKFGEVFCLVCILRNETRLVCRPDNILRFIRCSCNISKKRPCSNNTCSCKKHGLVCVSACGNCNGIDCENYENEVDMDDFSDEEEDRNIFDVFDD